MRCGPPTFALWSAHVPGGIPDYMLFAILTSNGLLAWSIVTIRQGFVKDAGDGAAVVAKAESNPGVRELTPLRQGESQDEGALCGLVAGR